MSKFIEVTPKELQGNFFKKIGEEWMLITAEKDGVVNTMTAAWGGIGIFVGKPVAHAYIRYSRYTKEFVEAAGEFSLTFFGSGYRDELNLLGTKSGRDLDKIQESKLDVLTDDGIPYFEQAELVLFCKTIASTNLDGPTFRDGAPKFYDDGDFHTLYIAEITKALVKE